MVKNWRLYLPVILLALVGIGLIGYALYTLFVPPPPVVEIIHPSPSPTESAQNTLVVDVEGAVEHPGVYTLPASSRISDALIAAGGLSVAADKNYLARSVNLASTLVDGSKIYIPKKGESLVPSPLPLTSSASQSTLINVNSASLSELDSLWGIGTSRAQNIIDNRPYQSLDELKTKANLPTNVYDKIKSQLTL